MIRTLIRGVAIVLAIAAGASTAAAEKKIAVKIQRFATLGSALAGRQIVVGPLTGNCSSEFAALLLQDLATRGLSAGTNPQPGAIQISIDVVRCEGRPREALFGGGLPATHIARTEGRFEASVRVVDLANGVAISSTQIRGEAHKQNEAQTVLPEYPAAAEVKQMAMADALVSARRLYVPWTDRREVTMMNNKDCNLGEAYELAKNGAYVEVFGQSHANVETCRGNGKMLGAAWYNLGIASILAGKYADALSAFAEADKARGPKAPEDLVELCRLENAAAESRAPRPVLPPLGDPGPTRMILTNDLILKMIEGNMDEAEILKMIEGHAGRYSVTPADVEALRKAGASDSVVSAMQKKMSESAAKQI